MGNISFNRSGCGHRSAIAVFGKPISRRSGPRGHRSDADMPTNLASGHAHETNTGGTTFGGLDLRSLCWQTGDLPGRSAARAIISFMMEFKDGEGILGGVLSFGVES
jgi:hypothetical protein